MEAYRRPNFALVAAHLLDLAPTLDRTEAQRVMHRALECSYDYAKQSAAEMAEDMAVMKLDLPDDQSEYLHDQIMEGVIVSEEEGFLRTLFLINDGGN